MYNRLLNLLQNQILRAYKGEVVMGQVKTCGFAALAVICVMLMALGCADLAEDTIQT